MKAASHKHFLEPQLYKRRDPRRCSRSGHSYRRQRSLVHFLFLDGPLGRRQGLEALIRDRLAAFDGEAVRSGGETRFGALERVKVFAQVLRETLVELVLVEIGSLIPGIVRVG